MGRGAATDLRPVDQFLVLGRHRQGDPTRRDCGVRCRHHRPDGYLSDISRSFICPGKAPTAYQKSLLQTACDRLCHNIDLIKPGLTYREFAERCWPVPKQFEHNRYMMMVHGCSLADEYSSVAYAVDFAEWGYDGVFEENMVISVESYIGEQGATEGVKLEAQLLITRER